MGFKTSLNLLIFLLLIVSLLVNVSNNRVYCISNTGSSGDLEDSIPVRIDGEIVGWDPAYVPPITVFETREWDADLDLNNDGDKDDIVIRYYDGDAKELVNTGIEGLDPDVWGAYAACHVSEIMVGTDMNSDGDLLDNFIAYYNLIAEIPYITDVEGSSVSLFGLTSVFETYEKWFGDDLNGDNDTEDHVIRYYNFKTGVTTNTGEVGTNPDLNRYVMAFQTNEKWINEDLNGDGVIKDYFIRYISRGEISTLEEPGYNPSVSPYFIAFEVNEESVGADINGDGDVKDNLIRYYSYYENAYWTVGEGRCPEIKHISHSRYLIEYLEGQYNIPHEHATNPINTKSILFTCSGRYMYLGDSFVISGQLKPPVSGAEINLIITKPDETTITKTLYTENDGSFNTSWTFNEYGTWYIGTSNDPRRMKFLIDRDPSLFAHIQIVVWQHEKSRPGENYHHRPSGVRVYSTSTPKGQPSLSGISGRDGNIFWDNVAPGDYSFQVNETDYVSNNGSVISTDIINVELGKKYTIINIVLEKGELEDMSTNIVTQESEIPIKTEPIIKSGIPIKSIIIDVILVVSIILIVLIIRVRRIF